MNIVKPACAVAALFALVASDRPQSQSRSGGPSGSGGRSSIPGSAVR